MKAVLFKSWSENYQRVFENTEVPITFVEPLQFKFINEQILVEKLLDKDYDGIILTSPRAIEVVSKCSHQIELSSWRERKVYAVGEASGIKIMQLLNLNPSGLSSGNADNLAEIVIKENPVGAKFLFPCGNLKSETISDKLLANGMSVDAVTVYKTEENDNLKTHLTSLLEEKDKLLLFFFSPSGASYILQYLQSVSMDRSNFLYFAIGKSTCKKLQDMGIEVNGVAREPSAECLLEAMNNFLQS